MNLRAGAHRRIQRALSWAIGLASPALAPIVAHMARTGVGTDRCLDRGCLPLPVHFYSPVPEMADLEQRGVWERRSAMSGVAFRPEAQEELLLSLGEEFGHECAWPGIPSGNPYQFNLQANNFSYGCAAAAHCMVRRYRPRHVIEIGSGNSSLVLASALRQNASEAGGSEYRIVDPYPGRVVAGGLPGVTEVCRQRIELLDPAFFDRLGENDILFIDSGHTVRIGGDVNFLVLDVLPRLAPGVIIHVHDIDLPREYPKVYLTNPRFRVLWTEAYLLQAFLCYNSEFEVLLAMSYLMHDRPETFRRAFPAYDPTLHRLTSGSFWLRRRPAGGSGKA